MEVQQTARAEWRRHWPLVLSAMVGMSFYSLFAYSNQMFIQPLEAAYGWKRAEFSMGYTIFALVAFVCGPFAGMLIDRWGSRPIAIPGVALSALAFAALGFTGGAIWNWFALWAVLALVGLGVKSTVWSAAVSGAFTTSRGMALAVMLSGSAVAQFLGPLLANWLIQDYGWRNAYHYLGLGWGGFALLLVLLMFRHTARPRRATAANPVAAPALPGFTFRRAVTSAAIVRIFIANVVISVLGSGVTFHLKPILSGTGLGDTSAAEIASLAGISGIAGKLLTGWLLDRIEGNIVPTASFGFAAAGYFLLLDTFHSNVAVAGGVLILGFTAGAGLGVSTYLVSRYAGLRAFGAVYGAFSSMLMLGSALGPVIAGFVYDRAGSYDPLLIAAIPVALFAAALLMGLGPYPKFAAATAE